MGNVFLGVVLAVILGLIVWGLSNITGICWGSFLAGVGAAAAVVFVGWFLFLFILGTSGHT